MGQKFFMAMDNDGRIVEEFKETYTNAADGMAEITKKLTIRNRRPVVSYDIESDLWIIDYDKARDNGKRLRLVIQRCIHRA